MLLIFLSRLLRCLCVLISVAFYTLLERKTLGYIQIRKGPKIVGFWGILQPFADAVKLFVKEKIVPHSSNQIIFYLAPFIGFILAIFLWYLYPRNYNLKFIRWRILIFFCVRALNVYSILLAGWTRNSKYAYLGSLRASAQSISYEICLLLILLFPLFFISDLNIYNFSFFPVLLLILPVIRVWFTSSLAETNRAPFDFAEGESELVSGFNIEYGGGAFALLFLAEYANILFIAIITAVLFLYSSNFFILVFRRVFISMFFLFARGAFPRHRYDFLINICWKRFLPFSICSIVLLRVFF